MECSRVLAVFLVLLGVAGLAFWLYDAYYKARINKALTEGRPVGPIPEPRLAGRLIIGLAAAACVLGFLLWANRLQTRIEELESSIRSDMFSLSDRIDRNYYTLIEELRAENAVFAKYEYEITELDPVDRTVTAHVSAVPKEASAKAAVYLQYGDQVLPLERGANGIWAGDAVVGLRDSLKLEKGTLSVVEDGRERFQEVEFFLASWKWSHFPKLDATPEYLNRDFKTAGKVTLTADISFTIGMTERVRSFSAVVRIDGKTVLEKDLYEMVRGKEDDYSFDSVRLEGQFDLKENSVMTILIRFTDDLGFLHEYTLVSFLGSDGEPYNEQTESVYDTDGTLLFTDP